MRQGRRGELSGIFGGVDDSRQARELDAEARRHDQAAQRLPGGRDRDARLAARDEIRRQADQLRNRR
ncbi:hypothetical protein [Micromonospora sp. NPDC001898]|uniref:hypothetical protein n=1 Tax=Micromonospora sp. NPDC001898 TaxID=3364221 RepID=UPI0036BBF4D9